MPEKKRLQAITKLNIFQKMLLTFTVVAVIPLTFSFYIAQKTASDLIVAQNIAETINSLELVSNSVETLLEKAYSIALYVSDDESIRRMLQEDVADAINASGLPEQTLRLRQLERINSLNRMISNLSFNMIGVRSYIAIATADNRFYTSWSYDGGFSEVYRQHGGSNIGEIWTGFEPNYIRNDSRSLPYVWTIGKNIINPANKTLQGAFIISIPEQSIAGLLAADSLQNRAVLDRDNQIVAATHKDWLGQNFAGLYKTDFPQNASGSFQAVDENGKTILITYTILRDWKIVDVKYYDSIISQMNVVRYRLLALNVLCISAFVILASIIARGISEPLRRLAALMRHIDITSPQVGERTVTQDEVGILEESFHVMVTKNKDLIERNLESERGKRDAELKALQAQISPHFLFNTLNCIRWAAINKHNKKAADMTLALSNLLRMTIVNGDEFITIETEIANLQNYAAIFQMRQDVQFVFTETIPKELKSYRIPKLLLQPIIENALIHGLEGITEGGVITMTGESLSEGVCLTITDNGVGMDVDAVKSRSPAKGPKFSGIGVDNVIERIKLNFGEQYGLQINSTPGSGTTVRIFLPPHKEGDDIV